MAERLRERYSRALNLLNCHLREGLPVTQAMIMVVSPDRYRSKIVCECLWQAGYQVQPIETGGDALEAIAHKKPDLLLIEWELPDLNSLAVIRSLRRSEQAERLPIILWGANMGEEDIMKGLEAGADLCLNEAFHPQVWVARVRALLRRSRSRGQGI
jgi:two-component system phosphate regulon response regulator PhoB